MSNVTGYYSTPTPAAGPTPVVVNTNAYQAASTPASATPATPGVQPVFTSETWTPTSSTDPYVAGIRTSGAAIIAAKGAAQARTMSRWATMLRGRSQAGLSNGGAAIQSAKSV